MFFVALFVVICCLIVLSMTMFVLHQESRDPAESDEGNVVPISVGKISQRMDIPRKHPLIRTRNARSLP